MIERVRENPLLRAAKRADRGMMVRFSERWQLSMSVKPIPDGYGSVTPYLYIQGAARAIEFYGKAFGAVELYRLAQPDGRIGHAELQIGSSRIMLADEFPERGVRGPQSLGGTSVGFLIYVPDVDARVDKAVAAGARLTRPVQDQFYGDRSGTVIDPFGHSWTIATHVEDASAEEMERHAMGMSGSGEAG